MKGSKSVVVENGKLRHELRDQRKVQNENQDRGREEEIIEREHWYIDKRA